MPNSIWPHISLDYHRPVDSPSFAICLCMGHVRQRDSGTPIIALTRVTIVDGLAECIAGRVAPRKMAQPATRFKCIVRGFLSHIRKNLRTSDIDWPILLPENFISCNKNRLRFQFSDQQCARVTCAAPGFARREGAGQSAPGRLSLWMIVPLMELKWRRSRTTRELDSTSKTTCFITTFKNGI
ncbi:hypothetical protein CEXT_812401 [Caerostris extrusa]|uniref:Uncharacterized protein n=1 Tax=Caerostris extrusa TaxID=172846 RepID=A0AAV4NCZ8_CAEEX|nr:hypothetical protein CEXT_812401 [Caerostris extrusa]